MSTRNCGTQTQLKVGGIVLKLNSKNFSTTGFFFWENFLVSVPTERVRKENCSCLLALECEEGCPKRRQYITIVNHFHGVSSCFGFGGFIPVPYPCKVRKITSHQRNSKKGFVCAHFSHHNSPQLSLAKQIFLVSFFYVNQWCKLST